MPPDDRIRKKFLLVKNTELKRQVGIQCRYVERRRMIDCVNVRLRCVHFIERDDAKRREDGLHRELRPKAGERVQDSSISVEKSERNRGYAKQNSDKPDQRIEKQIRAKATEQAVSFGSARLRSRTMFGLVRLYGLNA